MDQSLSIYNQATSTTEGNSLSHPTCYRTGDPGLRGDVRSAEGTCFTKGIYFATSWLSKPGSIALQQRETQGKISPWCLLLGQDINFFFSLLKIYPSSNPPETAAPRSLIDMGGKHFSNVPRAPSAVCASPHQSQLSGEPQRERSTMQNSPSLAITSASITAQPSSRSTATTVLFPDAIPPESPTRNIVL